MLTHRVVPVLLANASGLVKTTQFKKAEYVGDPINVIRIFNDKQVDEIALLDIGATPGRHGPNFAMVEEVASECFMPLAYGGGIRDVRDVQQLFSLGVDKVVIRSAAANSVEVVRSVSDFAGAQSVAVAVDVRRDRRHRLRLHAPGTTRHADPAWTRWIRQVVQAGAGEIVLTAVHKEGTRSGLDLGIIRAAATATTTPLLAVGGVGSVEDIRAGLAAGATAIGAGAFFIYHGPRKAVLISYPDAATLRSLHEESQ